MEVIHILGCKEVIVEKITLVEFGMNNDCNDGASSFGLRTTTSADAMFLLRAADSRNYRAQLVYTNSEIQLGYALSLVVLVFLFIIPSPTMTK